MMVGPLAVMGTAIDSLSAVGAVVGSWAHEQTRWPSPCHETSSRLALLRRPRNLLDVRLSTSQIGGMASQIGGMESSPPQVLPDGWDVSIIWMTGWVGFCGSLLITQLRTAKALGGAQAINNMLFVIHFALLGAWGGVASQIIGICNGLLKYQSEIPACKRIHAYLPLALVPLAAVTYEKPLDILPSLAVAGRLVAFQASNMARTRLGCMIALLPWIPYSLKVGSNSSLVNVCLSMTLQAIAIARLDLLPLWKSRGASKAA